MTSDDERDSDDYHGSDHDWDDRYDEDFDPEALYDPMPRYLYRALRQDEVPQRPPAFCLPRIRPTKPDAKKDRWDAIHVPRPRKLTFGSQFIHCSESRLTAL
mgnify:CR=1 FL=1|jgi:hypothetical protein